MTEMKLLTVVTLLGIINLSLCKTKQEICSESSNVSKFWKCSLRKLPNYFKTFYIQLADCVRMEKGISDRNDALAYFSCSDQSLPDKVEQCFGRESMENDANQPSKMEEKIAAAAFTSCSRRAFPDDE